MQDQTLEQWEARMAAEHGAPRPPRGPRVDWVVNGHGQLLDPAKDVLDPAARRMLDRRQARG